MTTKGECEKKLKAKGLRLFYKSTSGIQSSYWGFDEMNSRVDHSAAIIKVGPGNFVISDMTDLPMIYPTPAEYKK